MRLVPVAALSRIAGLNFPDPCAVRPLQTHCGTVRLAMGPRKRVDRRRCRCSRRAASRRVRVCVCACMCLCGAVNPLAHTHTHTQHRFRIASPARCGPSRRPRRRPPFLSPWPPYRIHRCSSSTARSLTDHHRGALQTRRARRCRVRGKWWRQRGQRQQLARTPRPGPAPRTRRDVVSHAGGIGVVGVSLGAIGCGGAAARYVSRVPRGTPTRHGRPSHGAAGAYAGRWCAWRGTAGCG